MKKKKLQSLLFFLVFAANIHVGEFKMGLHYLLTQGNPSPATEIKIEKQYNKYYMCASGYQSLKLTYFEKSLFLRPLQDCSVQII